MLLNTQIQLYRGETKSSLQSWHLAFKSLRDAHTFGNLLSLINVNRFLFEPCIFVLLFPVLKVHWACSLHAGITYAMFRGVCILIP